MQSQKHDDRSHKKVTLMSEFSRNMRRKNKEWLFLQGGGHSCDDFMQRILRKPLLTFVHSGRGTE